MAGKSFFRVDIGVVIVTFNRINMLKDVLKAYDAQTKMPQYILVVNNASNDGTLEYLEEWKVIPSEYKKIVINMDTNFGGSAGFHTGLAMAEKFAANWIWVADDDAFPKENALSEAEKYLCSNRESVTDIAAICGMVINNGKIDIAHRRWIKQYGVKIIDRAVPKYKYKKCFEINVFSYVGTIINKKALLKAGLSEKDFFIWWDDTEHSMRLHKEGRIICVPAIEVNHDARNEEKVLLWKIYYGWRNKTYTYKKHFPKLCYKYFYYSSLIISYIKIILRYKVARNKIKIIAIHDANQNKLGMHDKYRPGWIPEKNIMGDCARI